MYVSRLALFKQHHITTSGPFKSLQCSMNPAAIMSLDEPDAGFGFISTWWWRILKFNVVPWQETATFSGLKCVTGKEKDCRRNILWCWQVLGIDRGNASGCPLLGPRHQPEPVFLSCCRHSFTWALLRVKMWMRMAAVLAKWKLWPTARPSQYRSATTAFHNLEQYPLTAFCLYTAWFRLLQLQLSWILNGINSL